MLKARWISGETTEQLVVNWVAVCVKSFDGMKEVLKLKEVEVKTKMKAHYDKLAKPIAFKAGTPSTRETAVYLVGSL